MVAREALEEDEKGQTLGRMPTPKSAEILAALENAYDSGGLRIYDGDTSQGDSEGIILKSDGTKIHPVN